MTKQVRTAYRSHRKAAWVVALALVGTVAAVVIPLATGAPDKTYKFEFPATGAVTPALITQGNTTLLQKLCTDTTYTSVKLTISNTAANSQLGSADVTFPSFVTLTGASFSGSAASGADIDVTGSNKVVSLRDLSLPKRTGTVTFSVSLNTSSTAQLETAITARVKAANDFSDSGTNPDANAFDNPTLLPKISLQTCNATISGRVYHDRDQSGLFAVNANSPTSDVVKSGWTVTLQRQTGATTFATVGTDTTDAMGLYDFTASAGSNYRLCVTAASPDNASAWAVRQVAGVTLSSGCSAISPTSPASKGVSVAPLTTAGATGQDFALVPVTVFDFEGGDTAGSGNYIVTAGGDSTKIAQHYTQETFTSNGRPFFIFAPINACAGCGQIYLLEHLQGTIAQSALGADKQVSLLYDDTEPFTVFLPMPYCLQDPRGASPTDLLTANVLPEISPGVPATSCIVEGHQTVDGDGTALNALVDVEFFVYSSYDGGRGMG